MYLVTIDHAYNCIKVIISGCIELEDAQVMLYKVYMACRSFPPRHAVMYIHADRFIPCFQADTSLLLKLLNIASSTMRKIALVSDEDFRRNGSQEVQNFRAFGVIIKIFETETEAMEFLLDQANPQTTETRS